MQKTFMSVVFAVALLLLSIQETSADQLSGNCSGITGRVLQYGLAKGDVQEVARDPSGKTPAGMTWRVGNIRLLETTYRIPLVNGNMIFQSYEIAGLPPDQPVQFTRVTEFPPMTGADGKTWTKRERTETFQTKTGSVTSRYGN